MPGSNSSSSILDFWWHLAPATSCTWPNISSLLMPVCLIQFVFHPCTSLSCHFPHPTAQVSPPQSTHCSRNHLPQGKLPVLRVITSSSPSQPSSQRRQPSQPPLPSHSCPFKSQEPILTHPGNLLLLPKSYPEQYNSLIIHVRNKF